MSILIAILGLGLLILVHELGHFLIARLTGMRVLKFSVGFGPAIVSIQHKGTAYQLACFPLGGFVQVAGMGTASGGEQDRAPGSFVERPLWARAAMVSAGPIFNFGFAMLVYVYLFATFNAVAYEWHRHATPVVREVTGPAAAAGLQPFDTIEKMGDRPITTFRDIQLATGESKGEPMVVVVARGPGGELPPAARKPTLVEGLSYALPVAPPEWTRITLTIHPEATDRGFRIGVSPVFARFGADSAVDAVRFAGLETWTVFVAIGDTLRKWADGTEAAEVASVVKITSIGADNVKMGSEWFLNLLALLSINLGLLNLLPLPALDGGRLIFIAVEAIARRPVPPKVETAIHAVGMILILGLMLVVMATEVVEIF